MEQLQKQLVENLKGYEFVELLKMLNDNEVPEIREAIMDAMEKYQRYIFNELARGVRRGGSNYPTRAEMTLKGYRTIL